MLFHHHMVTHLPGAVVHLAVVHGAVVHGAVVHPTVIHRHSAVVHSAVLCVVHCMGEGLERKTHHQYSFSHNTLLIHS